MATQASSLAIGIRTELQRRIAFLHSAVLEAENRLASAALAGRPWEVRDAVKNLKKERGRLAHAEKKLFLAKQIRLFEARP